ncbi:MAG: PD-(D/E)XK nuclease family transposase [Lachnospiraceae bacterium]|nr:PD-(D/E)XK nuclease family transposase [Lachnospiraceae bacterium]
MSILKEHFPMIRDREAVIKEISQNANLKSTFNSWTTAQQNRFLDYCTGERGLKICYDPFFKEVFNVEYDISRLNDFLSSIMGETVEIISVLPNEGARISCENNLLITDILVRLENGSLVNVEIQKIGYTFPGARASCYSADLLLREYKRMRDKDGKKFNYKDIMPVYTIVIFEESPAELRTVNDYYIHKSKTIFDSGAKVNLLQNFIFISLDNFKNILQNRIGAVRNGSKNNILSGDELLHSRLEEWLMFLSVDEPELIEVLLRYRPCFRDLYEDIYKMCLNTERLMSMYSEILSELDRNTVVYMIDELKAKVDSQKAEIDNQKAEIKQKDAEIERLKKLLEEKA